MQIELVGLPALGRSALTSRLLEAFPNLYKRAYIKFLSFKKMLLFHPIFTLQIVLICIPIIPTCVRGVAKPNVSFKYKIQAIIGVILNTANYKYLVKNYKTFPQLLIWDELLMQRALSVFAYSDVAPDLRLVNKFTAWAKRTCSNCVVFIVNESLDLERILIRGAPSRMKKLSPSLVKKMLLTHYNLLA